MAARGRGGEESRPAAGRGRSAAAGPPALPPPDAHVRALSAAHAEKTKSLLKSIDRLKAEISTLRAANKEHHRSAHIRALQRRLREQELVSHVLKQSLQSSSSMSSADVDDLIIRKTVAGPLRFRPKSREELANEVRALAHANEALRSRLATAPAVGAEVDAAALREETAHLRTAVESREALLGRQAGEIEELERRVEQLTAFEDKARRLARKYLRVKAEAASLAADRSSSRGHAEEVELSSRRLRDRAAVLQAENADLSERLRREVAQRGAEAAAAEAEATALRRRAELAERAAEAAVSASGTRLSDLEAELGKVRSDRADLESRLIQASIDLRQSESRRETAEANAERSGSLVEEQRDALAALRKAEAEARERLQRAEKALAEALRDVADARRAGDAEGTQGAAERGRAEAAERRRAALESELKEAEAEGRRWRASASMLRRQMVAARQLYRQESRRAAGLEALLEGRGPEGEDAAMSPVEALDHDGDDISGDEGGGGSAQNADWRDDQAAPEGEESLDGDCAREGGGGPAAGGAPAESVDPFADEEDDAEGTAAGGAPAESVDPFADEEDMDDVEAGAGEPSSVRPPRHAGTPAPAAESSGAGFELSQSTTGGDNVDGGPSWAQLSADD